MADKLKARSARLEEQGGAIELAPDEVDAVSLFFALGTQWRHAGLSGVRTGIDYSAVAPTAAMMNLVAADHFRDLRLMEEAALAADARA